ncbi:MAG: Gfo/Idh/MocA family oxidoreductase [Ignavibacteria bacterium]
MNNRFRNDMMLQRTFTKAKELGEIFYIKAGWIKPQSSNQKWMLEKEKSGGGVFLDNGIAMLDLALWLLDFPEAKSVTASNYSHYTKSVEDSSIAMIKFKNNTTLTIEVAGVCSEKESCFIVMYTGRKVVHQLILLRSIKDGRRAL